MNTTLNCAFYAVQNGQILLFTIGTSLSKYIWSLKRKKIDFEMKWKILERAQPFSPVSEICNLCTTEKYYIVFEPQEATINQLDEINGPCLHKHAKLLQKT